MARLLGTDKMLFSTGDAVDSPFVERGCRTKLTVKVENIDSFLENWSSGLHRVIFYGDHTRDLQRYCRFAQIRLVREGTSDVQKEDGLGLGSACACVRGPWDSVHPPSGYLISELT